MFPLVSYEMVRKLNEERRERSMKRFWWRYATEDETSPAPAPIQQAVVVEMVFGDRCDAEEPIGA